MKHRPLLQLALMASLATAISGPVFAQDFVEPASVRTAPQRFWAKEIAFQDRLIELPSGKTQAINDRTFYSFRIAELGAGYADQATYEKLKGMRLEQEYLFTGTVLERRGKYYVVVRSVDALFKEPNQIEEEIKKDLIRTPEELKRHRKRQLMVDLMNQAQASMLIRSRQGRFEFKEYFNPDSPQSDEMQQMIQNVVAAMEREGRMSASDLLSIYIRDVLSDHYMGTTGGVQDILIPEAMLKEINAIVPPPETSSTGNATPTPTPEPVEPPAPEPLPIAISTNEAPMVVEGNLPEIKPDIDQLVPPAPPTPGTIIGNEPDEVLERLLNDAGGPTPAPEVVVPAPEPTPPVVTPEPEPPVVTPAPVEPAPMPEPAPEVVVPAPEPTPEVIIPAPEPEPPVVTPEPEPPVVVPAPEPAPEIAPPVPEPAPEVVVPAPEPEPPVVTPAPVEPEPVPAPEPMPEVAPAPEPAPPVVVTPEPAPAPVTTIPEPVPAEKITPPAAPVKPIDPPPRKRGLLSRIFGGDDEPAPPKTEKPMPPPVVETKPAPPRIPDEDRVPKPPRKPDAPAVTTTPPAKKDPVAADKPDGKTPPAPTPAPAQPGDDGVYDPAVDFHFKNLPKLPK